MNLFSRISATLNSKVEDVVAQIENHDAVIEVALKDAQSALAKARVRLNRVQKDGAALRNKLNELENQQATWTERAKATAKQDEAKALECVGRRNLCREQAECTRDAVARHVGLEENLTNTVKQMEQRLADLTQQRNLMRTRESTADAMRVIHKMEACRSSGIEDAFDRWETVIAELEYGVGMESLQPTDPLEASFADAETSEALKADLAELLDEDKPKKK